jgi:hypothetical protein
MTGNPDSTDLAVIFTIRDGQLDMYALLQPSLFNACCRLVLSHRRLTTLAAHC